jgi:hypothetical protein
VPPTKKVRGGSGPIRAKIVLNPPLRAIAGEQAGGILTIRLVALDGGGRRISELRQRLEDTEIEIAEMKAEQQALVTTWQEATNAFSEVEFKRIELEILREEYRHRAEAFNKLEARLQQHVPPTVTLLPLAP